MRKNFVQSKFVYFTIKSYNSTDLNLAYLRYLMTKYDILYIKLIVMNRGKH